jgi:DNA-binding FadR family transcriptional regulator
MTDDVTQATPSFRKLERAPHVSASVAEQILKQIQRGTLPAGARLPSEVELAKNFGVSRPSVREALAALQFAGHVESRRGFGTVVLGAQSLEDPSDRAQELRTLDEAVDLLETRIILEPAALVVAADDPDLDALEAAKELIGGMHAAVDQPELHASTDISVHRALLTICRNRRLRGAAIALLDLSLDPLLSTARTQAWSSGDLPHAWADQHDAVCRAIAAGDGASAREASLAHLASVVENLAAATVHEPKLDLRVQALMHRVGLTKS